MKSRKSAHIDHLDIEMTDEGMVAIKEQGGLLAILDLGAAIDLLHRKQVKAERAGFTTLCGSYSRAIRFLNGIPS